MVGASVTADSEQRPFAYDLGAASPVMMDLGTLGGHLSVVGAASGAIVAGGASTSGGKVHAVAWLVTLTTVTSLVSSANPALPGSRVVFTATVAPNPSGGTVGFSDNGVRVSGCQLVPVSGVTASCGVTYSHRGAHTIVAAYSGTSGYADSTSPPLAQVISAPRPPGPAPGRGAGRVTDSRGASVSAAFTLAVLRPSRPGHRPG